MDYKEMIKGLESNGLNVFEIEDIEFSKDDIVLIDGSIDSFIKFCKVSSSNIVFFSHISVNQDDFDVYVEDIKRKLNSMINDEVTKKLCKIPEMPPINNSEINFDSQINIKAEEIANKNTELMNKLFGKDEEKTFSTSMFTVYNSDKVGIIVSDNSDCQDIISEGLAVDKEMQEFAHDLVSNYFDQHVDLLINKMEQEQNAKMQAALAEVKEIISGNNDIKSYTNATLRKSYARKLIEDCERKHGFRVPMWEVELMVTDAYNKTKKKK